MSLTVKVYLNKSAGQDGAEEIRRFAVDPSVAANFMYLREKVCHVFPSLTNKSFQLLWKDSENDFVAFSSDDELTEALGWVKDGIFRVYIRFSGASNVTDGSSQAHGGERHVGVTCDGCQGGVCGIRYKCSVCPDFDLCEGCFGKGDRHTVDHEMVTIRSPRPHGFSGVHFMPPTGGMGGPFCPPGPQTPGGCGPAGPHHQGPWGMGGPHHPPGPWGPYGPWMRGCGWKKWMKKCAKYEWKTQKEEAEEGKERKEKKEKKDNDKSSSDSSSDAETGENNQKSGSEDYLKNVGQSVAAMLDPLGIDVEIDVEHRGKRKRHCRPHHGGGHHWGPFGPWGWRGGRHCGFWGRGGPGRSENWATFEAQQQQTEQEQGAASNADAGKKEEASGSAIPPSQPPPPYNIDSEMREVNPETGDSLVPQQMNEGDRPQQRMSPDRAENGWTLINDGVTGARDEVPHYPDISQLSLTARPTTDPVIATALHHLMSMGFTNEGEWLTRLLEVKNGDINQVLDVLRPHKPQ